MLLLLVPLLGQGASQGVSQGASQGASQGVSRGVLVHHRPSGKLYAVNAHLEPGQLFRTGDGRVFTLANSGDLDLGGHQHHHQQGDQHRQGDTRRVPSVPALSPAPALPVQVASQVHALPLRVVDTAAPRASPRAAPSRVSPSLLTTNAVTPTPSSALVEGFFSFPSAGIDYQFKQRNKI